MGYLTNYTVTNVTWRGTSFSGSGTQNNIRFTATGNANDSGITGE
jgi:hypothetical protein